MGNRLWQGLKHGWKNDLDPWLFMAAKVRTDGAIGCVWDPYGAPPETTGHACVRFKTGSPPNATFVVATNLGAGEVTEFPLVT